MSDVDLIERFPVEDIFISKTDGRKNGRNKPYLNSEGILVKKCPKCLRVLPRTSEFFGEALSTRGGSKDNLYPQCRECKKTISRIKGHNRYTFEKEKMISANKKWLINNTIKTNEVILSKNIAYYMNAKSEVTTDFGKIDVLTDRSIIEIKKYDGIKSGLGQLLFYGNLFPNHNLYLIVFCKSKPKNSDLIISICLSYRVNLVFHELKDECEYALVVEKLWDLGV